LCGKNGQQLKSGHNPSKRKINVGNRTEGVGGVLEEVQEPEKKKNAVVWLRNRGEDLDEGEGRAGLREPTNNTQRKLSEGGV